MSARPAPSRGAEAGRAKIGLCAIMRNEAPYILEWLAYHRVIGFDRIVIYDNQSTDDTALICRALARSSVLDYVPWPDDPSSDFGIQVPAYQDAAKRMPVDWIAFLDADEFLTMERAHDVHELIADAGRAGMPIALNWRNFGSNGHLDNTGEPVTSRFTRRSDLNYFSNEIIKTIGPIAVLRAGAKVYVHGWELVSGQYYVDAAGERVEVQSGCVIIPPRYPGYWINHYPIKSRREFEEKMRRGSVSKAVNEPDKYTARTFENYFVPNDRNEEEDRTILRFQAALLAEMDRLKRIVDSGKWWLTLEEPVGAPPPPVSAIPVAAQRAGRRGIGGWVRRILGSSRTG